MAARQQESKSIWSYHPSRTEWKQLSPEGSAPPFGPKERVLAYLDPARYVFVVIGYDRVWCYQYQRRTAESEN